ncbi:GNAT family N-acetyltransferase [Streptomyces aureoverticillatus]|uniref:GNAT family N-acetyltransferase n=1 Tax=Streptomyces aureoverticillatus TaxID=66871 RepID=UPI0013DCB179|nr:GNAT family N-acetyltransferase [Streptomyces aureoverticillatus]QIB45073.1 GNAT family N-acetyltransferase [Streptomyces aureoverticillatus]
MLFNGGNRIDEATAHAVRALRAVATAEYDWTRPAGGLEWSCLFTAEHIGGDFTGYAGQLTGRTAGTGAYVPFDIHLEEGTDADGAVRVVEATAGMLAAVVRTTPPGVRGWHPYLYGSSDAAGFAAMGSVELLLHTYDILRAFDVAYEPPAELCEALLARQFPKVAPARDGEGHWEVLLWATGRGDRAGHGRLERWRWHNPLHLPAGPVALVEVAVDAAADLAAGGDGGFRWVEGGPFEGTRGAAGRIAKAYAAGTHRPEWGMFAVVREEDQLAVGAMGFHGAPDEEGWAEVGYDLVPAARGNGYATQALSALAEFTLGQAGDVPLSGLRALADPDNTASHGVLTRAGFVRAADRDANLTFELRRP